MSRGGRALLVLAWIGLVAALGWYVQGTLKVSADLRLFMPSPKTPAQRLLLEEIGEGPGARLLLIALDGAAPESLAATSRALAAALAHDPLFGFVANGDVSLDDIPDALLAYRYLLSPTLDEHRFDTAFLHGELQARTEDLASPMAGLLEPWLPRDPTLETLKLAQSWQPAQQPERLYEVWFDRDHHRALLVAQTRAAGFDPDAQRVALDALHARFEAVRTDPATRIVISGPGAFAVQIKDSTAGEAQWLGTLASIGMVLLMLAAYRSFSVLILGTLPLISAGLAGLAAVGAAFGSVHGITVAFGFTLIGVAQDYPMHLFSHQHPALSPLTNARTLWPTLATGVASTCIAYLAFLASGVNGLAQLACFTITGLAVAGLTTRFALPRLIDAGRRDYGGSSALGKLWSAIERLPRPRWLGLVLVAMCVAVLVFAPWPLWENNLATLTPVPPQLLKRDIELRHALGAPDVRHLLVIEAADVDAVLARGEALVPALDKLVAERAIDGYDLAARYLPSQATQLRRQALLPERATLQRELDAALVGLPFRAGVFEPFLGEVERARTLPPLTPERVAGTPLELRVAALLLAKSDHAVGLVSLSGVHDAAALARLGNAHVAVLDLKAASEELVASYRNRILVSLAIAALLLIAVVAAALRSLRRARRVLAPMALTTLLILGALHGAGVSLSLFHLIALVLAAGLGLDYALFFEHAAEEPAEQRRTLHAVLVCSISTLMVFALLIFSSIPVLRAIGVTVSLGVVSNFVLALLLTRTPGGDVDAGH